MYEYTKHGLYGEQLFVSKSLFVQSGILPKPCCVSSIKELLASFRPTTHLVLRDVDRGAVVEAGGLVVGVVVERRLEVLGDVDDDRGRQTRDDVAATEQWKELYLKDVYKSFSSPFLYISHNISVLFTY